jgi:Helix-turn-helix domain
MRPPGVSDGATRTKPRSQEGTVRSGDLTGPRLLTMRAAAGYLGVSYWTIRDWLLQGLIPVVPLPPLKPREGEMPKRSLRRTLVDRADLDAFIDACKHRGPLV